MHIATNALEHQLINVLVKIELNGVKIDIKKLNDVEHQLLNRLHTTTGGCRNGNQP